MTNILGLGVLCLLILSCNQVNFGRSLSTPTKKFKERTWFTLTNSRDKEIYCGTVFLKTEDGKAKRATEEEILLVAVNKHTTDLANDIPKQVINLEDPTLRSETYHAITRSDSDGRFCFKKVPQGRFYMIANVPYLVTSRMGDPREMWKKIDEIGGTKKGLNEVK